MKTTQITSPKTPQEVKEAFADRGESVAEWAKRNGFRPQYVYDLLNGRTVGTRGMAHRAAVLLGLKKGVIEERTAS